MNRLCFGTFAKSLQNAIQKPNSNQAVAELLLGLLVSQEEPFTMPPKIVSGLFNFKDDVQEDIVAVASTAKTINAMPTRIAEKLIPSLNPTQIEDAKENLRKIIKNDGSIAPIKRDELLNLANMGNERLADFLSEVFMYAIARPNKSQIESNVFSEVAAELTPMDDIARLNAIYAKIPRPKELSVPNEPTDEELKYISQLLAAYAEAIGISELSRDSLNDYTNYNDDLRQRRKEYYAAETVRRSTRDVFKDSDSDQFDLLKEETYDGIFDVYSQKYRDGYERLLRVMTQVSAIQINKSSISKLPEWIGNKEKKGVCHILVNDGRISWVVRDE